VHSTDYVVGLLGGKQSNKLGVDAVPRAPQVLGDGIGIGFDSRAQPGACPLLKWEIDELGIDDEALKSAVRLKNRSFMCRVEIVEVWIHIVTEM
jgi:hypothetical protein